MVNKYRLRMRLADEAQFDLARDTFNIPVSMLFKNSEILFEANSDPEALSLVGSYANKLLTRNIVVRCFRLCRMVFKDSDEFVCAIPITTGVLEDWETYTDRPDGMYTCDVDHSMWNGHEAVGAYL